MAEKVPLTLKEIIEFLHQRLRFEGRRLDDVAKNFELFAATFPRRLVEGIIRNAVRNPNVQNNIINQFGRKRQLTFDDIVKALGSVINLSRNPRPVNRVTNDLINNLGNARINPNKEFSISQVENILGRIYTNPRQRGKAINRLRTFVEERAVEIYPGGIRRALIGRDLFQVAVEGAEMEIFRTEPKVTYRKVKKLPSWAQRAREQYKKKIRRR